MKYVTPLHYDNLTDELSPRVIVEGKLDGFGVSATCPVAGPVEIGQLDKLDGTELGTRFQAVNVRCAWFCPCGGIVAVFDVEGYYRVEGTYGTFSCVANGLEFRHYGRTL